MLHGECTEIFKKPTEEFRFDIKLKKIARDQVYFNHTKTFYCDCDFTADIKITSTSGTIDPSQCGYQSNSDKVIKLEWEHIVAAANFGKHRDSWTNHNDICGDKSISGRMCSGKTDPEFRMMEADLHNLVPEIERLNRDRGDKTFGIVAEEERHYGKCDFEVSKKGIKVVEVAENIRGDVARAWLYMYMTYGAKAVPTSNEELEMFCEWHKQDPVDVWEQIRNERITAIQGNSNPYVDGTYTECAEICAELIYAHDEL
jgi:deoxyribonuclease-1